MTAYPVTTICAVLRIARRTAYYRARARPGGRYQRTDDVTVVCCTEFGRTPGLETRNTIAVPTGRDHHPHAFTVWFAGAGIRGGTVHGATDELGFHAVEHPHYVTDIHATLLHLLGLDPHRLDIPGRKRLEIDYGRPIREIMT